MTDLSGFKVPDQDLLAEVIKEGKFRTKTSIDTEVKRRRAIRVQAMQQQAEAVDAADLRHVVDTQHTTRSNTKSSPLATVWNHLDAVYCIEGGDLLGMVSELVAAAKDELLSGPPFDVDGLALLLGTAGREVQQAERHLHEVVMSVAELGYSS